ncbi:MAG: hypothetical protein IPI35_10930 [Deltaproteobacteria bacterium]|nr:hypothetical protein [Deltaproteobacteria bacterium]
MRAWALTLSLVVGCAWARRDAPPPPPPVIPPAAPAVVLAGGVVDGRFLTTDGAFSLGVPSGWTTLIGREGEVVVFTLTSPNTGMRVRVARVPGQDDAPRVLPGCRWTFQDAGPYDELLVADTLRVGTCTPDDPQRPRVLSWRRVGEAEVWHLEAVIPPGQLYEGLVELEAVLPTARFPR